MKTRKVLSVLMAILLVVLAACSKDSASKGESEEKENLNETGFPIVEEQITLKVWAAMGRTTVKNWNDHLVWNTYEDMTNINVEWEQVESEAVEEKRNLSLVSGNLPDVYYAANMPTTDIFKYGQQGSFIKLNDLVDKYAPNLKKLMDEYPEIRKAVTFPDGNIYSLPVIYDPDFTSVRTHPLMWYNSELLDKYGMDIPATTEEYYNFLKTVKEKDPDITPYGSDLGTRMLSYLRGSFNVGTTGRDYIDKDPETGELRFYPITDNFRELLEYANKLHTEKLIEPNIYTIELAQFLNNGGEDKYASMVYYAPEVLFGEESGTKYVGGLPLKGPHGDQKWARVTPPVGHIGKFIITSENKHPEATMRWIDHFYGDEGARLAYMGVEGDTFEIVDGKYKYTDKITNSSGGLTKEQEISKHTIWIGNNPPGILMEDYFDGSESSDQALEAAKKVEPFMIEEVWPPFTYTEEETKKLAALASDIEKYVLEMQDKFVIGDEPFSNWDKFVKNIETMGLDEYMEIQEAAYERFLNN